MPRILYADDDETSRLAIARLMQMEGYECVVVPDGMSGAEALRASEFDCVISDLNMEGNDNLEFIKYLAQLRYGLPVIIVTGYPSVATATAAFHLPVTAYLTKPIDVAELLKQVRAATTRSTLLQQLERMQKNHSAFLTDLDYMASGLRQSPRAPLDVPMGLLMAITYRNVLEALMGLKTLMESSLPANTPDKTTPAAAGQQSVHSPLLLVEALSETIGVLEKTKDSFRSRDLGELRKKLAKLLNVEREQRTSD